MKHTKQVDVLDIFQPHQILDNGEVKREQGRYKHGNYSVKISESFSNGAVYYGKMYFKTLEQAVKWVNEHAHLMENWQPSLF